MTSSLLQNDLFEIPRLCIIVLCIRDHLLLQGNADQDVLLGQRAGDTGGQQVRHGARTCDIVRAGQNARR